MTAVLASVALPTVLAWIVCARVAGRLRAPARRPVKASAGRRYRRAQPDYSTILDAIARQVRSGSSLAGAIVAEVDRSSPLGDIVDRLTCGESLVVALAGRATENPHPDLALTMQALSASAHLGGSVAATLDDAAAVLRERLAARAERTAHASQAQLSARVLTIVPVAFAVVNAVASRQTRDVYVATAAGTVCAMSGLVLNVCGWRWMKRIIGPA